MEGMEGMEEGMEGNGRMARSSSLHAAPASSWNGTVLMRPASCGSLDTVQHRQPGVCAPAARELLFEPPAGSELERKPDPAISSAKWRIQGGRRAVPCPKPWRGLKCVIEVLKQADKIPARECQLEVPR